MASLGEVAFILKRLADSYSKPVSDEKVRAYHTVLQRYPRMVLVMASKRHVESSKFFPQVSELVEIAERVSRSYAEPDWAKFDEATYWYLYVHSRDGLDELTEDDVQKISRDAGITQGAGRPVKELGQAEVRAICAARGWPVSKQAEKRQAVGV